MPRAERKTRGVFERDGAWWVIYYVGGKRFREKVGRKSDATALYQKRKAEGRAGTLVPDARKVLLAEIIDRGVAWYRSHRKPMTARASIKHLEVFREALGNRVAVDLTAGDIDRVISKHKDWTPATMNRHKSSLSRALQLAVIDGLLKQNVARLVSPRREHNTRVRWLKPDEEARLREHLSPELTLAVEIAIHTGMRKGEQFTLTWDEIDFDRGKIFLQKTKNGSDREVPMNQTCRAALMKLKEGESMTNDAVFQSTRYDAALQNPRKAFDTALRNAKVKDFKWHDLRHTFCSRLAMKGVPLLTISKLAGHKSIAVTMRYAHLAPEHLAGAVDMLD